MSDAARFDEARLARPHLLTYYRIAAVVTVALVLLQALLAGRWIGKLDEDYLNLHEIVANLVFLAVLALGGLAIALGVPAAWKTRFVGLHALLVVLVVAQIGLGYGSREAIAWHVPNGVLIFGLAVYVHSFLPNLRRMAGAA
jgi:hypothetical protein